MKIIKLIGSLDKGELTWGKHEWKVDKEGRQKKGKYRIISGEGIAKYLDLNDINKPWFRNSRTAGGSEFGVYCTEDMIPQLQKEIVASLMKRNQLAQDEASRNHQALVEPNFVIKTYV